MRFKINHFPFFQTHGGGKMKLMTLHLHLEFPLECSSDCGMLPPVFTNPTPTPIHPIYTYF